MADREEVDFTDIERRLDRYHEWRARMAASYDNEMETCGIRKCRRDGCCSGPMVLSPHLEMAARARALIGLKSDKRSRLPLCVADERGGPGSEYALTLAAVDEALGPRACNDWFERKLKGRPWR